MKVLELWESKSGKIKLVVELTPKRWWRSAVKEIWYYDTTTRDTENLWVREDGISATGLLHEQLCNLVKATRIRNDTQLHKIAFDQLTESSDD